MTTNDESLPAHDKELDKVIQSLLDPETTGRGFVEAIAEFLGAVTGGPLTGGMAKALTKRLMTTPIQARLAKEIATLESAERMREALRPILREFAERTSEEIRAGQDLEVALIDRIDELHKKLDQLVSIDPQRRNTSLDASIDAARARGDWTAYKDLRRVRRGGVPLAENSVLAERYAIIRKLGTGGFADVWLARDHANEQRLVALKVLHPQYARDETRRDRFFRGARKQAELNSHPHVVSVLDARGEAAGYSFFVMEFVDGSTLQAAATSGLPVADVRRIVTDIGNALRVAHHKQLLHRDVKPSNILLDARGRALLTDFDLVAAHDTTGGTRTGALGTFMYAPSEMLENAKNVDERTDQFGLAMSAVYALFSEGNLPSQVLREPEAVIEGLELSPRARAVLAKAVGWTADKRFPTMMHFVRAFRSATKEPSARTHANPPSPSDFSQQARRLMQQLDEDERTAIELRGRGERLTTIAAELRVDGAELLRLLSSAREQLLDLARDEELAWPETTMLFAPGHCVSSGTGDGDWLAEAYRRACSGDDPRPGWRWGWAPPSVAPASIKAATKLETGDDIYGTWLRFTIDAIAYTMRWVPPGEFIMGAPEDELGRNEREGPPHLVRLTRGFWLGETLCTEALWSTLMNAGPSTERSRLPATGMDGAECETFLGRLNERMPDLRARLAREAEWEYACRAGTQGTRYGELDEIAWHADNSGARKHDVGQKQANAWGLQDMLGNVWEWCGEGRREYTSELQIDPVGPRAVNQREARGGSYNVDSRGTRSAYRRGYHTGDRVVRLGFRIASDHM